MTAVLAAGCADFVVPTAREAAEQPFGTGGPFVRGTTKDKVLDSWGPPDHIVYLGVDELGVPKEEWIYKGRLPNLPIDVEYVSRTKHLFFEGETMVRWKVEKPTETVSSE